MVVLNVELPIIGARNSQHCNGHCCCYTKASAKHRA